MAAAERIVRDGGTIVMAAACADGVPAGGAFARLLAGASTPAELAGAGGGPELDRWQAQVLGPRARPGRGPPAQRRPRRGAIAGAPAGARSPTSTTAVATALERLGPEGAGRRHPRGPADRGHASPRPCEAATDP